MEQRRPTSAKGCIVTSSLEAELAMLAATYKANFAGRNRKDVDLALIEQIALRAANVAIQAGDLWNVDPTPMHEMLRRRFRERLHAYQAEHAAVRGWKQGGIRNHNHRATRAPSAVT